MVEEGVRRRKVEEDMMAKHETMKTVRIRDYMMRKWWVPEEGSGNRGVADRSNPSCDSQGLGILSSVDALNILCTKPATLFRLAQ